MVARSPRSRSSAAARDAQTLTARPRRTGPPRVHASRQCHAPQAVPLGAYAGLGLARLRSSAATRRGRAPCARSSTAYPAFGPRARAARRGARQRRRGSRARRAGRRLVRAARRSAARCGCCPLAPHRPAAQARALARAAATPPWREFLVRRALAANPHALDVLMEMAATLQAAGRLDRSARLPAPGTRRWHPATITCSSSRAAC